MKSINLLSKIKIPFLGKINVETKSVQSIDADIHEKEERLKKLYYIAVKTRNFEITQLVQRNNFFMIFQGVLIACVINSNNTVPVIHTIICLVGIGISFYQMQAAAGAKFWQEHWETEVSEAEDRLEKFYKTKEEIDFHRLFNKNIKEIKNSIYTKFYKNDSTKLNPHFWKDNQFKADSNFWAKDFYYDNLIKYFPFTPLKTRILSKPSVSKIPIQVGRFLLCIWLLTLFSTTQWGAISYNYLKELGVINGLPGKSITNIDIRNQKIPHRQDGFDDSDEIKKLNN